MLSQEVADLFEPDEDSIDSSLDETDDALVSNKLREFLNRSSKDLTSSFCEAFTKIFKKTPTFIFKEFTENGFLSFTCEVLVKMDHIVGSPKSSKKYAKMSCCQRALEYLLDSNFLTFSDAGAIDRFSFSDKSALASVLRQHAYSKFYSLASQNPSIIGTEMVLAAFFLFDSKSQHFEVVSLATGSKCIQGPELSISGSAVVDCHAEILARRGVLRFLYTQLFLHNRKREESIFRETDNGKLMLRGRYTFHLFINTPPCGDGRVFEKSGNFNSNKNAGILRYKIEKGMGTVFGDSETPQTIDGILSGSRLRIMSCSDKLLRWNVLGLQGCILSRIVVPVYMSSLNIGEPVDISSLKRAVYGRLENPDETVPFHLNKPSINCIQKLLGEEVSIKPSNNCMNWNISDNTVELLITTTGLVELSHAAIHKDQTVSRLSKLKLMCLWKKLLVEFGMDLPSNFTYNNLKASCEDYEQLHYNLNNRLEMSLGIWQRLPSEISSFEI